MDTGITKIAWAPTQDVAIRAFSQKDGALYDFVIVQTTIPGRKPGNQYQCRVYTKSVESSSRVVAVYPDAAKKMVREISVFTVEKDISAVSATLRGESSFQVHVLAESEA